MVEAVRRRLNENSLVVFNTCKHTIMEFQSWSYKRTASGEIPPGDDRFEDRNNDCMDVIKGVVSTNPVFDQQQIEVETGYSNENIYSGGRRRRYQMITLRDGRQVRLLEEDDGEQEE
jgi:hypothetical protein